MTELAQVLERIGLTDKEAKVYLASLHLGGASIQDIAEEAGINRTTTYVIIRSLIEKGLASSFNKGKKRQFTVENPEQLKSVLSAQEGVILEKRKELGRILPGLHEIYHSSERRPQVRFLEGKEGLLSMERQILYRTDIDYICSFVPRDELFEAFPDYRDVFTKIRVKRQVPIRIIYTSTKGVQPQLNSKEELREARYIPKEKFPFTSGFSIYGAGIQISNLKEPFGGVVIENKQVADSFRKIFDLAWEAAEKYQQ